jgi:hypothetical protein
MSPQYAQWDLNKKSSSREKTAQTYLQPTYDNGGFSNVVDTFGHYHSLSVLAGYPGLPTNIIARIWNAVPGLQDASTVQWGLPEQSTLSEMGKANPQMKNCHCDYSYLLNLHLNQLLLNIIH